MTAQLMMANYVYEIVEFIEMMHHFIENSQFLHCKDWGVKMTPESVLIEDHTLRC